MSSLLADILEQKQLDIAALKQRSFPRHAPRPVDLRRRGGPLHLITEIKPRSPSAGILSGALTVAERARCYERSGAAMISVLTDERFFGGGFDNLAIVRGATDLPVLCKDFIIDEVQLGAARAFGADWALLIVRCLEDARLSELVGQCRDLGLGALVEVTTEDEATRALNAGATIIGVNARDLDTLEIDRARARRVLAGLPEGTTKLHLSGVRGAADIRSVANGSADAALLGEALMREDDPSDLLSELVLAAE